jgi:hypothetical protein
MTKADEDFKIFSDVYDEIARTNYSGIPGYVPVGETVVEFRKLLWKKFRINKKQFAAMLQRIRDQDRNSPGSVLHRVNLFGGPIYHKNDWVECDGRHWLLIEVRTEEHEKQMAPHRG